MGGTMHAASWVADSDDDDGSEELEFASGVILVEVRARARRVYFRSVTSGLTRSHSPRVQDCKVGDWVEVNSGLAEPWRGQVRSTRRLNLHKMGLVSRSTDLTARAF